MIRLFAVVVLFLFLGTGSCDPEATSREEQSRTDENFRKVENDLEVNELSGTMKSAYEHKAKQKLQDFYDYVQVLSDISLDSAFRNNARELILGLFKSEEATVNCPFQNNDGCTLDDFVSGLQRSGDNREAYSADSIHMYNTLERNTEGFYQGTLVYKLQVHSIAEADTVATDRSLAYCDVYVVKKNSTIGNETIRTWKLVLGNIHHERKR